MSKRRPTSLTAKHKKIDVTQARQSFADLVSEVGFGRDRVILCRHGRKIAALIPVADLELFERLEDQRDVAEARQILAKSKFYTSAEVRRKLGIN